MRPIYTYVQQYRGGAGGGCETKEPSEIDSCNAKIKKLNKIKKERKEVFFKKLA